MQCSAESLGSGINKAARPSSTSCVTWDNKLLNHFMWVFVSVEVEMIIGASTQYHCEDKEMMDLYMLKISKISGNVSFFFLFKYHLLLVDSIFLRM